MKSIIFDLDGTLWDVTQVTWESANVISNKYNLNKISKKTVKESFGLTRKECAEKYFPNINLNKSVKLMDEISKVKNNKLMIVGGKLYPKLKEVLLKLKENYNLFIVSNTAENDYIKAFIKTAKLENVFTDYIAASSLELQKGEAIIKIINDNKIEKAIYVGDTKKDLEASKFAKIPFIQAKYGFGKDLCTKYYINQFEELLALLDRNFKN